MSLSRPRVFVVNQRRLADGTFWPDLRPAEEHGDLFFLLPTGNVSLNHAGVILDLEEKMETFAREDFLLPVGDMTACILAASIAAINTHGEFRVLRWNGDTRRYAVVEVRL
jgi:hypothetical protein